jgi:POT family proton-dependent oligopeptide transporter
MTKISMGFFFIGLSFALLAFSAYSSQRLIPLSYILTAFLFQTMGEIYIVPITLSNITKYAPSRYLSTILSFWLMAIGYGHYLAGILVNIFLGSIQRIENQTHAQYSDFFLKLCEISMIIAIVLSGIIILLDLLRKSK